MTVALLREHAPEGLIAFGPGGFRTAADLRQDVGYVVEALPEATCGSQVLCVVREDRYVFAVSVLAAWARGHSVVLAPDAERAAVLRLVEEPATCAVLHDTLSGAKLRVDRLLAAPRPVVAARGARELRAGRLRFQLQTGPCATWDGVRTPEQLVQEVEALRSALGLGGGEQFFTTLAVDHPYGLMCGVLLPLLSGGALSRRRVTHALAENCDPERRTVLVTVPAQLSELSPESIPAGTRVVSSLEPLPAETAERHIAGGAQLSELFVSPEHGTIGVRADFASGQRAFFPVKGVQVSVADSGLLRVVSPFYSGASSGAPDTQYFAAMREDGAFCPLGPADDRVWVSGRLEDASELSQALRKAAGLSDVAVVGLPRGAEPREKRLFVALVGSERQVATLPQVMAEQWGPSFRAERVLSLSALPRNEAGTLSIVKLCATLGVREDGRAVNFSLDELCDTGSGIDGEVAWRAFRARVPRDYGYFEGHFPGYPILPAAAQLAGLVMPCIRRARADLGGLSQMQRLKFTGRILPGDEVDIELRFRADREGIDFSLRSGQTLCSSGHLVFLRSGAGA